MPKEKPSFYAVLPASVRYDSELSSSEKIFYAEITAMAQKEGYCWASNSYFAEIYDVANSTISGWVSSLKDKDHIVVEYEKEGKQVKQRNIYPIQKIKVPYSENNNGGIQKTERGYSEKGKENNTSNNNTSNNNGENDRFEEFWELYDLKKGKKKAKQKWSKLSEADKDKIFENVPTFLTHFSSKQFTPRPRKYLHNRYWEDEAYQQKGEYAEEQDDSHLFDNNKMRKINAGH